MTFTRLLRLLCLLLASLLGACGGGGSGSTSTTSPAPIGTGTFVDAPTEGLFYYAYPSGLQGTTDANGHFSFRMGDVVTFKLPLGTNPVTLGEVSPGSVDATVSVLSLRQGGLVAQLLQSLDHSPSPDYMDVGGLTLNPSDFDAIVAWFVSEGQTLPPGLTAQQMLAAAQSGADGSPAFRHPGGVSLRDAIAAARSHLDLQLSQASPVNSADFTQRIYLYTGYGNYGPSARLIWMARDSFDARIISMTRDENGVADRPGTRSFFYASGSNAISLDGGGSLHVSGTLDTGFMSLTTSGLQQYHVGEEVAGNYQALQTAALDLRNQVRTIRGYYRCDPYGGTTFVFSADGQQWSAYCESTDQLLAASGTLPTPIESGTVSIDPDTPELAKLTSTCGIEHYLGVLDGTFRSGTLLLLTPGSAAATVGRLNMGSIRQAATGRPALLQAYTGGCANAGPATPVTDFFPGHTLSGTFIGVGGLSASVGLVTGSASRMLQANLGPEATSTVLTFYQLPDSGSYSLSAPPGCTLQNDTGTVDNPVAFTVDCSNYQTDATYIEQNGRTWLLGQTGYTNVAPELVDAPFTINVPALPDSVPLRVCAQRYAINDLTVQAISAHPCFASGTGMAMPAIASPADGVPLYVKEMPTAHNYYSSDRRVTSATTTTLHVNPVSFVDGVTPGTFLISMVADRDGDGIADLGEFRNFRVWWPTAP